MHGIVHDYVVYIFLIHVLVVSMHDIYCIIMISCLVTSNLSQVNIIREELIKHHRLDAFAQSSVFTVDEFQVSIGGIYAQLV